MNNKPYFDNTTLTNLLAENGLDAVDEYDKTNDQIPMLETMYDIFEALSNDIETYQKIETEFVTVSAAYANLESRMEKLKKKIDDLKVENGTASKITGYMFYNTTI
ncbi:MAG: hypothetical protein LUC88_10190 [Prevotella sp.]|nr:hypothetical protein [Prevotella sp.]